MESDDCFEREIYNREAHLADEVIARFQLGSNLLDQLIENLDEDAEDEDPEVTAIFQGELEALQHHAVLIPHALPSAKAIRIDPDWIQVSEWDSAEEMIKAALNAWLPGQSTVLSLLDDNEKPLAFLLDEHLIYCAGALCMKFANPDQLIILPIIDDNSVPEICPAVILSSEEGGVSLPGAVELFPDSDFTKVFSDNDMLAERQSISIACVEWILDGLDEIDDGDLVLEVGPDDSLSEECYRQAITFEDENPNCEWLLRELEMHCGTSGVVTASGVNQSGEESSEHLHPGNTIHLHLQASPEGEIQWSLDDKERLLNLLSSHLGVGITLRSFFEDDKTEIRGYFGNHTDCEWIYYQLSPQEVARSYADTDEEDAHYC